jgi:uncharacterized membrane protein YeaQ/YmgE (transglycosylase-associated protein family)
MIVTVRLVAGTVGALAGAKVLQVSQESPDAFQIAIACVSGAIVNLILLDFFHWLKRQSSPPGGR